MKAILHAVERVIKGQRQQLTHNADSIPSKQAKLKADEPIKI